MIVEKHDNNYFKLNKAFFDDIALLMVQRNIFAHYLLDTEQPAITKHIDNKTIFLVQYKKGTSKPIEYSENDVDEIVGKIEKCLSIMNQMYIALIQQSPTADDNLGANAGIS
ncbi:MAG: hypothetical protein EOO43_17025 [Flavobacterium sp.]|nr:MAG: hypothetical protein EOO43_17025 [Flavobacterium sp.]